MRSEPGAESLLDELGIVVDLPQMIAARVREGSPPVQVETKLVGLVH